MVTPPKASRDGPWAPPGSGLTPSALVPRPGVCRAWEGAAPIPPSRCQARP